MNAAGRVEADGRFTIGSAIREGIALTSSGAGLGWSPGSSAIEGQDTLDFPIDIQAGKNVTSAVNHVHRSAVRADRHDRQRSRGAGPGLQPHPLSRRQPVLDAAVPAHSVRASRNGRPVRSQSAGRRLSPCARFRSRTRLWYDPAFLEQLDSASVRVSIADGEKKEQNIRVAGGA